MTPRRSPAIRFSISPASYSRLARCRAASPMRSQAASSPHSRAQAAAMMTFGRLVEPEEIAEVLLRCAQMPVLNGAVLHANLGQIER